MGTYDTRGGAPLHDPAADQEGACDICQSDPYHCTCYEDLEREAEFYSSMSPEPRRADKCHCGDDVTQRTERGYYCPACGSQWGY